MPIDLSRAGPRCSYPLGRPHVGRRAATWFACLASGAAITIFLWPKTASLFGTLFWSWVVGISHGMVLVFLGTERIAHEVLWYRAEHWNAHRQRWIDHRLREARRPLQVLGVGYSLPLQGHADLSSVLQEARSLIAPLPPRNGTGLVEHNRFDEDDLTGISSGAERDGSGSTQAKSEQVQTVVLKIVDAIESLVPDLLALSQYGERFAPMVLVLCSSAEQVARLSRVREALLRLGLPDLQVRAVPDSEALMVADAWLDSRDWRPVLVIAFEWHDVYPIASSVEGCVAILLNPGCFELPEPLAVRAFLQRPAVLDARGLSGLFASALSWGNVETAQVRRAWLTQSFGEVDFEAALAAAFVHASLPQLANSDAQRYPCRVVGDGHAMNPWLCVAAAVESRNVGAHLIVDRSQAAVLHVLKTTHDTSDQ